MKLFRISPPLDSINGWKKGAASAVRRYVQERNPTGGLLVVIESLLVCRKASFLTCKYSSVGNAFSNYMYQILVHQHHYI